MAKRKAPRPKVTRASKTAKKAVRTVKKAARKAAKRTAVKAKKAAPARKGVAKRTAVKKAAVKKATVRKVVKKAAPPKAVKKAAAPKARVVAPKVTAPAKAVAPPKAPARTAATPQTRKANLDRPRRTVQDIHGVPSSLDMGRSASAVRSGRAELEQKLHEHTSTSPALTAGDVDADWGAAESVGDEAPGGDNPTPDQDVVDEIGRALGVEYDDDEELQGGDEIVERDRHRWELDPGSSDDFDER